MLFLYNPTLGLSQENKQAKNGEDTHGYMQGKAETHEHNYELIQRRLLGLEQLTMKNVNEMKNAYTSHCTSAAALLNGVPPQAVRKIWGVAKMYETYVGAKNFQPQDDVFNMLRHVGNEYGATTGRPRQCNWMDWDLLEKAININGVTDIVFNKVDILQKIDRWSLIKEKNKIEFESENEMKNWMIDRLSPLNTISDIHFSADPSTI